MRNRPLRTALECNTARLGGTRQLFFALQSFQMSKHRRSFDPEMIGNLIDRRCHTFPIQEIIDIIEDIFLFFCKLSHLDTTRKNQ